MFAPPSPTTLTLQVLPFTPARLQEVIRSACHASTSDEITQTCYLGQFLKGAGAKTMVVESPYTDRHYIEEFSSYYATAFRAPRQQATRLHVFDEAFEQDGLTAWIRAAAVDEDGYDATRRRLNDAYLGFIVVRPLPSVPIGRTVLRPYRDVSSRTFIDPVHRVHLAGFELKVRGVAFQQQDVAVGACATTALWSALSAGSRATGYRGPTPYQVTQAATRHVLTNRVLPADGGLDLGQLLESIRAAGYAPYVTKPDCRFFDEFSLVLKCYLNSSIPVVLLLQGSPAYHAVTAVGFRTGDDGVPQAPLQIACKAGALRSAGLSRLYVHEDRLGPYARMRWLAPKGDLASCELPGLQHERYASDGYAYSTAPMWVYAAVVPLYPKLRLSAWDLITTATELRPLLRYLLSERAEDELFIDIRFTLSGKYIEEILRIGMSPPERAREFVLSVTLPRYVGVIRYSLGTELVCDVLCDTTDIRRSQPLYSSVLAFVCFQESHAAIIDKRMRQAIPQVIVV